MDKIQTMTGHMPEVRTKELPPYAGIPNDTEAPQTEAQYETSLAEFPLFLLAERAVLGIDCLKYQDTIMVKGVPVERSWKVTWSKKYGPGTQSTAETFFALFQFWAETGFTSPWIQFDSIHHLLSRRGISRGANNYQRAIADLHCLCNIYIEAKNAFFDSVKRKYVDAGFHLFESVFIEKETEGSPDPSSKGFIKASETLFSSVQKNVFLLGVQEQDFFRLPGLQQRLFLYLRKMFIFQKFNVRNIMDLARQIPIFAAQKKKIKYELKKAVEGLMKSGLLPALGGYRFFSSSAPGVELIRFDRADAQQAEILKEDPPLIAAPNEETEYRFSLIADMLKDEHSYPYYRRVAAAFDTDALCRALSETREFAREMRQNGHHCHMGKVFISRITDIAQEKGIRI